MRLRRVRGEGTVASGSGKRQADFPGRPRLPMWPWGDVDGNYVVNLSDVQHIILGFQGNPQFPMEDLDIDPCGGQGVVNLADAFRDVLAFQGQSYAASGCDTPCD